MSKKRLGLSTEPQPVFVGGSFALVMLLMQFYVFVISPSGSLLSLANNPITLINAVFSEGGAIKSVLWILQTATPVAILIFAIAFGKNHARFLVLPASLAALRGLYALITAPAFNPYYINYVLYIISFAFYFLTATEIIKTIKPFIIYTTVLCVGICLLSLFRLPPFVLFDKSMYLSDMIYFITYHVALANFARAVPMQKKANSLKLK